MLLDKCAAGPDVALQDLNGVIGGASRSSLGATLGGGGKKKAPRTLDFVVTDDLESSAPIVACAWLGAQVHATVLCVCGV